MRDSMDITYRTFRSKYQVHVWW